VAKHSEKNVRRFGVVLSCLCLVVGCTQSNTQTITVFAAASLQDAFEQLGSEFEVTHPGFGVQFSFNSSTQLSHQIVDGAPADVFASADTENIDLLMLNGEVWGDPVVFATNHLQILVALSAVDRVHSLADLSHQDIVVVLAARDVPLGRYSEEVLSAAGISVSPVSYESSASGVVSKVVSGEADAGIVYSSDVLRVGRAAVGVEIPSAINSDVSYPIVVTRHGSQQSGATQWVKFVRSVQGQEVLLQHGFSPVGHR